MDRSDLSSRNGGDACDHADEIARLNSVSAPDVEGKTDHASLVGNGAGFFAGSGMLNALATAAAGAFEIVAPPFAAVAGGWVGTTAGAIRSTIMIMSRRGTRRVTVLWDGLAAAGFIFA